MNLLAISGSLRAASSNGALIEAVRRLAPPGVAVRIFGGLASLPHFNPDLDVDPAPPTVAAWREEVRWADGLIVSSPEYARGVPGSLKNALDWLVSSDVFPDKPVALFNASPRSVAAQAALRLILETMSARMVDEACITVPILGTQKAADDIVADREAAMTIRNALTAFAGA